MWWYPAQVSDNPRSLTRLIDFIGSFDSKTTDWNQSTPPLNDAQKEKNYKLSFKEKQCYNALHTFHALSIR